MTASPRLGKADIHLHSRYSDGMMTVRQILDWVEEKTDLDVIAVTDHDDIEGGLRARELAVAGGYRVEVIVGAEISTRDGHVLALFVEKPVRSFRPLEETIEEIRAQGGLCVVPHPLSWLITSVGERALDRAMAHHTPGITALEVANPTIAGRVTRLKVAQLNRTRYGLAETGGSDAHFLPAIGAAYTTFPGRTAEDFRRALLARATAGVEHPGKPERIPVRDLIRQQGRSLVWLPAKRFRRRLAERRAARSA
ncbi:MAG: PHP-associated domain-containing protein [Chloroflexota bacterium]|nr:PHP domain-containing protein [Dehalococcoidia bacterium]MDW8253297.1 PHP-associated domain-containing protein [Chloroflexota bacterium]